MEQATLTISGSPVDVLLDPLALPLWNEAFLHIDGPPVPSVGTRYTLRVRPGLSGWLEYTAITSDRVEITWQVPARWPQYCVLPIAGSPQYGWSGCASGYSASPRCSQWKWAPGLR